MAKTKKKKKPLADNVARKKKEVKAVNPFEVKINRQKHNVLGRKSTKYDKGMPGVSRSKAIQRRNKTLLVEYKKRDKTNRLIDRRFGEDDADMSVEDKMLQRFAMERQHRPEKASLFQLNDEQDELTHFGQSLSEIEKFEAPEVSDSEDDEEEKRQMAKMVSEEHFGGFLKRKTDDGSAKSEDKASGKPKSWKERMEEIIAQSKKHKYERQSEKEKAQQLTEQLDKEWKDLRQVVGIHKRPKDADDTSSATKVDSYDIMVRELQFEQKGKPSDRLKTEEELAKEEKERLEALEADRVRRMKGLSAEDEKLGQKSTHRSADEIDESFDLDTTKKNKFQISYKDGAMVIPDEVKSMLADDKIEDDDVDGNDTKVEDDNDDSDGDDNDDNDDDDDDDENDDEDEDSDCDDAMARASDLESDDGESDEEDNDNDVEVEDTKTRVKRVRFSEDEIVKSAEDIKAMLKKKKEIMESAREEIPYTFQAPQSLDDLVALLGNHSDDNQMLVIDRLRKCHHPSLAEGNKEKLETLFVLLMQYFGSVSRDPARLCLASRLTCPIYELMRMSPEAAVQASVSAVIAMHEEYEHARRMRFPDVDVLMLLKLLAILFPTSDFRHPVITPAMLFMSQLLTQCSVKSPKDVASGLFLCQLFLEYVSLSRRFVPEAINFLSGVVFLAIADKNDNQPKVSIDTLIAPFKLSGSGLTLVISAESDASKMPVEALDFSQLFSSNRQLEGAQLDKLRIQLLWQSLRLIQLFLELYAELPAFAEIFAPLKSRCMRLSANAYPEEIQALQKSIVQRITEISDQPRKHKVLIKKEKPAMLKMYEPKVEDSFDGRKKHAGVGKTLTEKQKLVHKYRRELKGAVREIRRDGAFLAKHAINEQIDRDNERKRKVKEIYAMLANQEGEHNTLQRKRNRLK